jgi:hypothetical protein
MLSLLITTLLKHKFKFEAYILDPYAKLPRVCPRGMEQRIFRTPQPLSVLDIKLSRVAKALKAWSKNLVSQRKLALAICREVIE